MHGLCRHVSPISHRFHCLRIFVDISGKSKDLMGIQVDCFRLRHEMCYCAIRIKYFLLALLVWEISIVKLTGFYLRPEMLHSIVVYADMTHFLFDLHVLIEIFLGIVVGITFQVDHVSTALDIWGRRFLVMLLYRTLVFFMWYDSVWFLLALVINYVRFWMCVGGRIGVIILISFELAVVLCKISY